MCSAVYEDRTERKKIPISQHRMKKSVVSRKLAPPSCNLRSEFMITLPDREMLYVTRIFNGQYLMAKTTVRRVPLLRSIADPAAGHKGKTVVLVLAFYRSKFTEVFQFRYVCTCIDASAACNHLDLSATRSSLKI